MSRTFNWLKREAEDDVIDFGINALKPKLPSRADLKPLLAPSPDAPVMLPAYVDAWSQTSPKPAAEAEVSLFLHGVRPRPAGGACGVPRRPSDRGKRGGVGSDAVLACPPVSAEMLTVSLPRLQAWLRGRDELPVEADVEGAADADATSARDKGDAPPDRFVLYGGRRRPNDDSNRKPRTRASSDPAELYPNAVVVLPAGDRIPPSLGQQYPAGVEVDIFRARGLHRPRPARHPPDAGAAQPVVDR